MALTVAADTEVLPQLIERQAAPRRCSALLSRLAARPKGLGHEGSVARFHESAEAMLFAGAFEMLHIGPVV